MKASAPTTLTFWQYVGFHVPVQRFIADEYKKRFDPNLGLEVTAFPVLNEERVAVKAALAAQSPTPDIIAVEPGAYAVDVSTSASVLDFTKVFAQDPDYQRGFWPNALELLTINGTVVSVPAVTNTVIVYYNRGLFAQHGVNLRSLGLLNTRLSLIGPYTGFGLAFGTYIMKGFFEGLPRELEEAARLDGASEFGVFARVMLPLTRPALATVAIFLFLQNWNEFLFALTFITDGRMRTLPTGIYALLSSEFYGNYPHLAASLVLFSVPVLVLYFLFQEQFIEGLTAGALKH